MNTRELKAQMARKGIRNVDLAKIMGISAQSVSLKANGYNPFMLKEVLCVAQALDLSMDLVNRIFFDDKLPQQ